MASFARAVVKFVGVNLISRSVVGIQRSIARMTSSARRNIGRVNASLQRMNARFKSIGSTISRIVPGIGMISGAGLLMGGRSAIQTAAEFESAETAIRFISGTAEEADRNMNFLRKTVGGLKVDYRVTSESFKRFLGAMKATNYEAGVQRDMFYKMGTAVRVLGLDSASTERVFYALGEMFSKGQVMSQELKLQLGNALPGAVDMFAKSMGMTNAAFRDMMKEGKVGTKYIKGFVDYVYEQFKDGIPSAVRTTAASLTQLNNNWLFMMQDIGMSLADAGILDMLSRIMLKLKDWVSLNKEMIKLNVEKGIQWIYKLFKFIKNNWEDVKFYMGMIVTSFVALKIALIGVGIASAPISWIPIAVMAIGAAIYYVADAMGKNNWNKIAESWNPLLRILLTITEAIDGIRMLFDGEIEMGFEQLGRAIFSTLITPLKPLLWIIDQLLVKTALFGHSDFSLMTAIEDFEKSGSSTKNDWIRQKNLSTSNRDLNAYGMNEQMGGYAETAVARTRVLGSDRAGERTEDGYLKVDLNVRSSSDINVTPTSVKDKSGKSAKFRFTEGGYAAYE